MSCSLTICLSIFNELEASSRFWGKHKNTFFDNFKNLDRAERVTLQNVASYKGRHNFMHQYVRWSIRSYQDFSAEEIPSVIENVFWLLWLVKSEANGRETIRNIITPFMETSRVNSQLRSEIISNFPEDLSDILSRRVGT